IRLKSPPGVSGPRRLLLAISFRAERKVVASSLPNPAPSAGFPLKPCIVRIQEDKSPSSCGDDGSGMRPLNNFNTSAGKICLTRVDPDGSPTIFGLELVRSFPLSRITTHISEFDGRRHQFLAEIKYGTEKKAREKEGQSGVNSRYSLQP